MPAELADPNLRARSACATTTGRFLLVCDYRPPVDVSVHGYGEMRRARVAAKGLSPRARRVPKREARAILVSVPAGERVPPLILRLVTVLTAQRRAGVLGPSISSAAFGAPYYAG